MGFGDYLRSSIDDWRSHPIQNGVSTVLGALFGPAAGYGVQQGFHRYNDSQFANNMSQLQDRSLQQTTMDANSAMNAPLNDPRLSQFDNMGGNGGGNAGQDRQLAQALTGGGNQGAPNYSSPGAWSPQSYSGWNPNQANASQNFGLLDFLGPAPNGQPQQGQSPGLMSHQDHLDALSQGNGGSMPGNYGVSNFMVGGSPVIFGTQGNDMNGLAMYNPRRYGP